MVFDASQVPGTFEQRMEFLKTTLPAGKRFVEVVAQVRCEGTKHLIAERDWIIALAGEGMMLRQSESAYEARRSPTLLKVKRHEDARRR